MDAVEFLKTVREMCTDTTMECANCSFRVGSLCGGIPCGYGDIAIEQVVALTERWAEEHTITNSKGEEG